MTTEERMSQLVKRLHEKTQAKELRWEETGRPGTFQVAFTNYVVKIFPGVSSASLPELSDYIVLIVDENGSPIESASNDQLKDALPNAYTLMRELYEMARRQSLGVDEALDTLLGELI